MSDVVAGRAEVGLGLAARHAGLPLPPVEGALPERRQPGGLVDRFGRAATDLRVSLTDRCNLRCGYCMPPEGVDWMPYDSLLTDDEVIRLITVAVRLLGVEEVRFTGGEPLLRKGLERIVTATTALRTVSGGVPRTAITTNGLALGRRAAELAAAGLHRVNVSLDSLDRARFSRMTHRDRLDEVLAGLQAAVVVGLTPVKVNAVLVRGVNEDEAASLLRWAIGHGYELRFIEQMPLAPHGSWNRSDMVTARDILAILSEQFELTPTGDQVRGSAPAETWLVNEKSAGGLNSPSRPAAIPPGALGRVGIVASVTRPFCRDCNRTRLTADGQLRTCLFARSETDLRALIRSGATDEDLAAAWQVATNAKQAGHSEDEPAFGRPGRPMSAIGG
jgi:cyclic pyranopterin phosphate synthase